LVLNKNESINTRKQRNHTQLQKIEERREEVLRGEERCERRKEEVLMFCLSKEDLCKEEERNRFNLFFFALHSNYTLSVGNTLTDKRDQPCFSLYLGISSSY